MLIKLIKNKWNPIADAILGNDNNAKEALKKVIDELNQRKIRNLKYQSLKSSNRNIKFEELKNTIDIIRKDNKKVRNLDRNNSLRTYIVNSKRGSNKQSDFSSIVPLSTYYRQKRQANEKKTIGTPTSSQNLMQIFTQTKQLKIETGKLSVNIGELNKSDQSISNKRSKFSDSRQSSPAVSRLRLEEAEVHISQLDSKHDAQSKISISEVSLILSN